MLKTDKAIKVKSRSNGAEYLIGSSMYQMNKDKWILLEDSVEEVVYTVDVDESLSEISYKDLKALLKAKDIPFKGNASYTTLLELFENSEE